MTDVIQRIDIWAQSLCRELRQKSCLVPYSVMIEVIQAVGAALPPPPGEAVAPAVKVKPLEFEEYNLSGHKVDGFELLKRSLNRSYNYWLDRRISDGFFMVRFDEAKEHQIVGRTEEEAILRAQLEHERRILSAIIPDPHPAPEQPDAVQEAARVLLEYMPNYAMERAALESRARDDEGEFESLSDLLDFSGQNKSYTVVREALTAALRALEGGE